MKISVLLALLWILCFSLPATAAMYGVARSAAPVLNVSTFSEVFGGRDGRTLKTDRCGQVRELEYIALPGTAFRVLGEVQSGGISVFRVETDDYPAPPGVKLYLDSRLVELRDDRPLPRTRRLPPAAEIIRELKSSIGRPYVWGGNLRDGVPELSALYYRAGIPAAGRGRLTLTGLDCSGLLYQATGGWTPRNTTQLVSYGTSVPVEGKAVDAVAGLLEPLDLIVWNGHVLLVLDRETIIESRLECGSPGNGGVVTAPLRQRLGEIMRSRRPVDIWPAGGKRQDVFVVRRWYGVEGPP